MLVDDIADGRRFISNRAYVKAGRRNRSSSTTALVVYIRVRRVFRVRPDRAPREVVVSKALWPPQPQSKQHLAHVTVDGRSLRT